MSKLNSTRDNLAVFISTGGPLIYFRLMPATIASCLVSVLCYWLYFFNIQFLIVDIVVISAIVGWWAIETYNKKYNRGDGREIVVDEIAGQSFAFAIFFFLYPGYPLSDFMWIASGLFLSFRIFDILKPFPINLIDAKVGSIWIILDDMVAAFYAGIVMVVVVKIF